MTERATTTRVGRDELKSYIERVERLEEEKKETLDEIKSVYAEAKAHGFDTKALRRLVQLRKQDVTERQEQEAILDTYMHAIGMASEVPLFAAVGAMKVDTAARDQVIEAFKMLVPVGGDIIVNIGGAPVRLFRDDKGSAQIEDVILADAPTAEKKSSRKKGAAAEDDEDVYPPGERARTLPRSVVVSIADRAEQTARRKRELEGKAGGSSTAPMPPAEGAPMEKPLE